MTRFRVSRVLLVSPLLSLLLIPVSSEEGVLSGSSEDVVTSAKGYYDNTNTVDNYSKTWGAGNIHFGYFPDKEKAELTDFAGINPETASEVFSQAAVRLTQHLADTAGIGADSSVLDLGCGKGKPLMDMARHSKIKEGVGLDLASKNIDEANRQLQTQEGSRLPLRFVEGSFTALPSHLRQGTFTHVTSNVAFCHLHESIDDILGEAYAALQPGGLLAVVDFLGPDLGKEPNDITKQHVWKRLKFRNLLGHTDYVAALAKAGFEILVYDRLDSHVCYGYALLAAAARLHGLVSEDGALLADNYDMTVKACHEYGDVAMNLYVARKRFTAGEEF